MPQQHIPPHDSDAEASCLAAILISRDALIKVLDILQADDFFVERHHLIYNGILQLDRASKPVDLLTLKQFLQDSGQFDRAGGDPYLAELYRTVATSANAEFYARRIRELSLRRRLIDVSRIVVENCHDMSRDTTEVLDSAERDVFRVTEGRITSEIETIEAIVEQTLAQINKLYSNKNAITGISCGFPDIDNMLTGFHESELIILAARPSMGKTALALNFMNNIVLSEKKPAFFFSLEMPAVQLLMRMICIDATVDAQRLRTGHLNNEEMRS
ncbi:MAG: DnaB-like helicase C-terminal domain-containing protein, partial [Spirochaetota bacterium]